MNVQSTTGTARTALNGLGRALERLDDVATEVATPTNPGESFSGKLEALAEIPRIRRDAAANARVFETADDLLNELTSRPRL